MYCGIVLSGDTDEACGLAFLQEDDDLETASVHEDDEILDLLEDRRPDVVVLNAPPERADTTGFRDAEQDLVESGERLLPQGMRDRNVLERAHHLARRIESSGIGAQVIESDPTIVARQLDIADDGDLARFGVDPAGIESVDEFDAVMLAIVGRMTADDRTENHGLTVPEGTVEEDLHERDADEPEVERDERSL